MALTHITKQGLSYIGKIPYHLLELLYLPLDRRNIRRTKNIRLIPHERERRGGKYSYAEWAHVIGIFQTLMFLQLRRKEGNNILDVGCGTGLLGIASEPFISGGGKYVGIDVAMRDVMYCRSHFPASLFEFIHLDVANQVYAPTQKNKKLPWPLENESFDLVTALSVWTHLNEDDALFYFDEICRILKPNGSAIITFFILDGLYQDSLKNRSNHEGRFHKTLQTQWIFDQPSYGSEMWLHPNWVEVPEMAIGVTDAGLNRLLANSKMTLKENYQGNWKEIPGIFFQDVLIFQKVGNL